ncbi:MAG TPA: hypothetical protein VMA96_15610 [Solirubrobacteraceae bacterium]|nr:hypothetical protein [Solirubrobacteraceae bacterium]
MPINEAELPRSVRKGPLITVNCECGQSRQLHYGERWKCESCGRRFDTSKIPLDEYAAIRRTQLRYRLIPLGASLFLLAAMIVFFIEGKAYSGLVAVAFLFAAWGIFARPMFRSRYRRALSENLPTWNIKAD